MAGADKIKIKRKGPDSESKKWRILNTCMAKFRWKVRDYSRVNGALGQKLTYDRMKILEDQGRETFEALQDLYGELLDKERFNQNKEVISDDKKHIEFLRFKSDIHESYSTFRGYFF